MPARPAVQNRRLLGRRVAATRRDRGWTQEDLAERSGISVRYLQAIEAGQESLRIDSLTQLASHLELPLADLLDQAFGVPGGNYRTPPDEHEEVTSSRAADAPRRRKRPKIKGPG